MLGLGKDSRWLSASAGERGKRPMRTRFIAPRAESRFAEVNVGVWRKIMAVGLDRARAVRISTIRSSAWLADNVGKGARGRLRMAWSAVGLTVRRRVQPLADRRAGATFALGRG